MIFMVGEASFLQFLPWDFVTWEVWFGQSLMKTEAKKSRKTEFNATPQTVILLNNNWGSTLNVTASSQTWLSEITNHKWLTHAIPNGIFPKQVRIQPTAPKALSLYLDNIQKAQLDLCDTFVSIRMCDCLIHTYYQSS